MVQKHIKKFLILMLALAVTITGLPLSSLSGVEEADAVSIAMTGSMHSDDLAGYGGSEYISASSAVRGLSRAVDVHAARLPGMRMLGIWRLF